jgi:high-affinity nickel-transport protein
MLSEEMPGESDVDSSQSGKIKLIIMYILIVVATLIGFTASTIVGRLSELLAGLGIVAYVVGLRHAVDADHIAAIDNTTRKLTARNLLVLTLESSFHRMDNDVLIIGGAEERTLAYHGNRIYHI